MSLPISNDLPTSLKGIHRWLQTQAWYMGMVGPFREQFRAALRRSRYRPAVRATDDATLTLVQAATAAPRGNVMAVLTARNELQRLPVWLAHYRSLGVGEFRIIDNGSVDGTLQYLCEQPDVTVYSTTQSYRQSLYGIGWVNRLMHEHGRNKWTLFVDADELLYFPGMSEPGSIQSLAANLDRAGQTYLYAPLIDLYNYDDELVWSARSPSEIEAALRVASHDLASYTLGERLPNGYAELGGGPRWRMSGGKATSRLVKYPMVRHRADRYFTGSSHEFLPHAFENHEISGWLVHLKLGSSAARLHADPAIEREHYRRGQERGWIANGVAAADSGSIRFEGVEGLQRIRLKQQPVV